MPIDLVAVYNDALLVLEIECPKSAPAPLQALVISYINEVVQTIQQGGPDFQTEGILTFNTVAGTASYSLESTLQNVVKPVRLADGTALTELQTRGDYDLFGQVYLGQICATVGQGKPMAFYLNRVENIVPDSADSTVTTMLLAPTPDDVYAVTATVIAEPVRYEVADLTANPVPLIPIAHQYVEAILMPLVRFACTKSNYFKNTGAVAGLTASRDAAMQLLGLADPQTDAAQDVNERKKAAARAAARQAYNSTQ
jgi:hypothetical protein